MWNRNGEDKNQQKEIEDIGYLKFLHVALFYIDESTSVTLSLVCGSS